MQYILGAAALVASTTFVSAAPFELNKRDVEINLDLVSAGTYQKNGPLHMMDTYAKYAKIGAKAPSSVVAAAAAATQSGSVAANPQSFDESYLCPVNVGGTVLNLDFDTGSSDLWVFSTLTPAAESKGHSLYDPSKSGKKLSGASWNISYGDSSGASGVVYTDKVVVGGVTATKQAVEAATSLSAQFVQDKNNDGLLGLAFSSINTVQPQQQTTFYDTVASTLKQKLFAADLRAGTPGSYQFGYIDKSKYTGSITYVPVDNSQGFWGFTAGNSIGKAIADTGTSLVYLPPKIVDAYYKTFGATFNKEQAGYVFPCSTTPKDYTVTIGSGKFTIPGAYINYAPVDDTNKTCFGGIQYNTDIGISIFGDVFLKAVYAIFDQSTGSPRLGFAAQPLGGSGNSTTPSGGNGGDDGSDPSDGGDGSGSGSDGGDDGSDPSDGGDDGSDPFGDDPFGDGGDDGFGDF